MCQRISMRQYASGSSKDKEWIREIERNYMGLQRARSALSAWPAHQPHRSPGEMSVRGPIVVWQYRRKEKTVPAKEFEVKDGGEDRVARTQPESERRRRKQKWQICWCCRDQGRAGRMAQASAEKLEHIGPAEKERVALVPQNEQLARTPELPLPKRKETEPSVQITRLRGGRESR